MECTFLLGKTPASKRKKPHSEVEILEARLENIESTYSERLSQMESLLSKVMPTPGGQEGAVQDNGEGSSSSSKAATNRAMKGVGINTSVPMSLDMPTNDDQWIDINSPQEKGFLDSQWDHQFASPSMVNRLSSLEAGFGSVLACIVVRISSRQAESNTDILFTCCCSFA